jgi:hypothetical protein
MDGYGCKNEIPITSSTNEMAEVSTIIIKSYADKLIIIGL